MAQRSAVPGQHGITEQRYVTQLCCQCPHSFSDWQLCLKLLHTSSDRLLTFSCYMSCLADQHRWGSMLEDTKLEDVCQPQEVFFLEHHWTVSRALEASYLRPTAACGAACRSGCGLP